MTIGTPTAIISPANGTAPGSGLTLTFTTTAAIAAGNLVVFALASNTINTASLSSVTDGTNTYSKAVGVSTAGPSDVEIWYCANAAAVAAGATITATYNTASGNGTYQAAACQVSGIATTSALDKTTSASSTSSPSSLSMTTAALASANEIVFGFAMEVSTSTATYNAASGFTNFAKMGAAGTTNIFSGLDYDIVSSSSAVTYGPSWATSGFRALGVVATFVANPLTTLPVAAGSFTETGEADTFQVREAESAGSFAERGETATLAPQLNVSAGSVAEAGEAVAFQVQEACADGTVALTGETIQIAGLVSFGTFALTREAAAFQTQFTASYGVFGLAGPGATFDPSEPVGTGYFALSGPVTFLSYDLLGGGGVITGGTFSRKRWHDMLAAEARREREDARRRREKRLRKAAERRDRERAFAEARRRAREDEKARGEAATATLRLTHAAAAARGLERLRAIAAAAAAQSQAGRAAASAPALGHEPGVDQDEEEAIALLLLAHHGG